mgnify:CR=1 FL=1
MQRRRALGLLGASAAALAAPAVAAPALGAVTRAPRPLRILILGGTRFIGLHMTEYALARGHRLTFFNRGRTATERFKDVERITGDRNDQLDGLRSRQWDAVIDNSGYVPRHVRLSARLLRPNVPRYLFISSISVYTDFATPRNEYSAVGTLKDESVETVDANSYGPLKALSENTVRSAYGDDAMILRPGLIVGPDDNTDRFTYWPARAARGGNFIAPNSPRDPVQFIDVRDLAEFTIHALEREVSGTFNVVSPPGLTIGQLIEESVTAATEIAAPKPPPKAVWLPNEFLAAQGIKGWSDLPVWQAAVGPEAAFAATSAERALRAGLTIRELRTTVTDTLRWHLARPARERATLKAGLSAEREQAALALWAQRQPAA